MESTLGASIIARAAGSWGLGFCELRRWSRRGDYRGAREGFGFPNSDGCHGAAILGVLGGLGVLGCAERQILNSQFSILNLLSSDLHNIVLHE